MCKALLKRRVSKKSRLHEVLSTVISTGCPVKKYIQLKMFIFQKVWNKFKQNFHGCKNILLPSFKNLDWISWDIK